MNLLAVVLAANLLSAAPPVFNAKTIDGRQVRGVLTDWEAQTLVLKEDEQSQSLALDRLLSIVPAKRAPTAPTSNPIWVTLVDGSVILANSYLADAGSIKASTSRTGIVPLPPASVDYVRFRATSPALQTRWDEILGKAADQDILVVASGNSLDYLGGVVRSVREQEVDFELDGDVLAVRRIKVFGIRYYRPNRQEASKPVARVTDDSGSTWVLQHVTLAEPERVIQFETGTGLHVTLPLDAIAKIDFAGAGLVYLTDLTPNSYRWTPYFGEKGIVPSLEKLYRPRNDTALDSTPIVLDGIQYDRGLALHSRTEITYRLPEPFQRFQALAGIDDRLRPRGNVLLRILGDNRVLYEGSITGTDSSVPIDISVNGVQTLTIIADFGSDLDSGDHLILAEAKLLK